MNIFLIHYAVPPVVGGVETVLAKQASQMARAGHHVSVLTGRGETWDEYVPVHVLPLLDSRHPEILSIKADLDQGIVPPSFETLVETILAELQTCLKGAEVVILHNVASLHKNLALTAALHRLSQQPAAPPFILWHHDLAWTAPRYANELHPGYPWYLLRTPWQNGRQVVVSAARRQELAAITGINESDITIIPNGVDTIAFHALGHETQILVDQLNLLEADPLLLAPVRLTRRKNLQLALHVVSSLRQSMPKARLVITGPLGAHNPANLEYMHQLLDLRKALNLQNTVHLLAENVPNGLTDAQVADFYRLADGLLITSQEEGFGIPIIEAGLARLIIFCSDLPSLRALAADSANYFSLHTPPPQIAAQMAQCFASDSRYQLSSRVRNYYTWEAVYRLHITPLLEGI